MNPCTERDTLWYRQEASCFQEALPLGNGTLGAMVWGGATHSRIGLNHDELWTGVPSDGLCGVDKASYFKAQKLALVGDLEGAQNVLNTEFCQCARVAAYQPLGEMVLDAEGTEVKNYRRALHLREGIAEESFEINGIGIRRECFVSYPDHCLVLRIEADRNTNLTFRATSPLQTESFTKGNEITVCGVAPIYSPVQIQRNAQDVSVTDAHGMRFCMRCAIQTDGEWMPIENGFSIREARTLLILLTAETSYAGFDKHPLTEGKDERLLSKRTLEAALSRTYEALKETHIRDVSALYDRTYFSLGDSGCAHLPTDERLQRFQGGEGDEDMGLYALMFNYGRYLTIAGSRPGSRAMNLQGIWNEHLDPPWSSNYTVNINLEMNYFATTAVNLTELTEPLDEQIRAIAQKGRKTAEVLYGARGFVCHHNSDIWGATVPIKGDAVYSFWPFGSAWLCRHMFEKYEYTLDRTYLESVYPILCEAARFYLDILVDLDGFLAVVPSTSPENTFLINGKKVAVAKSATMGMSTVRELFENCLAAAKILGRRDGICAEIEAALPRLMPLQILPDGRLEEWYFGKDVTYPEHDPHHRHISQLYALHPARQITQKTPALMEAAKRTLKERGDDGTGWSIAWKANFYARLGDGDHALSLLNLQLKPVTSTGVSCHGGGTYPNLFCAHPPFQIDGNFGYVSAVCEMLLQYDGDQLIPLGALPKAWKNGEVRGLRVKGNKILNLTWKDGSLTHMELCDA